MQLNRLYDRSAGALGRTLLMASAVFVWIAISAGSAAAYPQFQFSTYNAQCNVCHYAPAGGGLINGFGRDESGDTISSFGGDGSPLYGLAELPDWFAFGLDLRGATVLKKNADERQLLYFPMQADLYTRFSYSDFSLNLTAGMRGTARSTGNDVSFADRVVSREHFLMWQQGEIYARGGRFHAPYGLRLQDHTAYLRRYLGQHTLEETYNLSGGFVNDEWEFHATLFAPAPLVSIGAFTEDDSEFAPVGDESFGGALYYERRNEDQDGSYGVQTKVSANGDTAKFWLGGVYKYWLEEPGLLFLSQLDLGLQTFSSTDADARMQLQVYLGANYILSTGWMLGLALERYDEDVLLSESGRDGASLSVQYFPMAHIELMLVGKMEFQGEDYAEPDPLALFMLHYYL